MRIFILLLLFASNAYALDLREYLPETQTYLNTASGKQHSRYTFFSGNASLDGLYYSFHNLNKSGVPTYWKKDYFTNGAWCTATYAILFKGDDESVTETGDWFASTPCTPNVAFGYRTEAGANTGLAWTLNATAEMNVWRQSVPGAAYTYSNYQAFSRTGAVEVLPTFTPKYGRTGGIWAEGNGTIYSDVVHIVMYHGTRKDTGQVPVRCTAPISAFGAYYQSFKNYNSYAIELWLAKGIGIVQERTTFVEDASYWGVPNCNGYVFNQTWEWYKDEITN